MLVARGAVGDEPAHLELRVRQEVVQEVQGRGDGELVGEAGQQDGLEPHEVWGRVRVVRDVDKLLSSEGGG